MLRTRTLPCRTCAVQSAVAASLVPDLDKAELLRTTNTATRLRLLSERMGARMAGGGAQGCAVM